MSMKVGGASDSMSDINVTPFIDVCLVLLIIFMIVTPIVLKGFDINVPPKASEEDMKKYSRSLSQQLIITVTSDGRIKLNQEEIAKGLLLSRVIDVFEQRGGKKIIFFNAEDDTIYGLAVEVMDILKQAGAETIGIVPETIQE
ncbi:ExbD/TolR family protein [candidate division CSSED10-310 bacterium]|uniref:ExbD/TolR family protein n=1 Tax=candidate division CSSED10-310 bacterium TaxID=2855610 RepID=A0ABV6YUM3_UNCC1